MTWLIIRKELREIIISTKFAVTFAVCALLILLSFYAGLKNHQMNVQRYDAAVKENLKQMEGLTDWSNVRQTRAILPPQPLASLVAGISNDIGGTSEVRGRGELTLEDSPFSEEPVFAVLRFLDLEFIFQVVLSLFAILFAYDAINGEKERGTLRLTFSNAVPRDVYIIAKLVGSFLALALPLLIPVLLGCLLFPLLGVPMSGEEWVRLALILLAGFLYVGVFLGLSVAVSGFTHRSSSSLLLLLVLWVFAVLIIPRTAVLVAGRAVDVPSVDEIASQKSRLNAQLWGEDRSKMSGFKPAATGDMQAMVAEFQKFMQDLADARDKKMSEHSTRLNEERRNKQLIQQRLAFGLARCSPAAAFSLAATSFAGTSLFLKEHFLAAAQGYQTSFASFITGKTGLNPGGNLVFRITTDTDERPKPIDPLELPKFTYAAMTLADVLPPAIVDAALLVGFNLLFVALAVFAFLRYDLR
jgi:ABC-type transport system involved in multi-copper enzyme maturation permease subunit